MNEFESDWISLSQSQNGVRVFLSESQRRKQGVWIQDSCHHQVESEWMSEGFFVQMVGTNLGKCEWVWQEKLRWLNPRWQYLGWLPSSSWVRMNEFESDWISLSQSQNGVRVFLSESQRRKQGVWIQNGRIQDGCHHQVESEWMSEVSFVQMVGTNLGKCEWVWEERLRGLNSRWLNSRWQNSRWLPSWS